LKEKWGGRVDSRGCLRGRRKQKNAQVEAGGQPKPFFWRNWAQWEEEPSREKKKKARRLDAKQKGVPWKKEGRACRQAVNINGEKGRGQNREGGLLKCRDGDHVKRTDKPKKKKE